MRKVLYIDFTGDSLGSKSVKYHGGGDFSRFVLWKLHEENNRNNVFDIKILWPQNVDFSKLSEEEMTIRNTFEGIEVKDIADIAYNREDILFLPLLDAFSVKKIGIVRHRYPKLRLYGVLHGLRLLDVCKYDKYDKYYYSGYKSFPLFLWPRRWVAGILSRIYLAKYLRQADRIYTVSNCSMQKINKVASIKYIKYFTRDITPYSATEDSVNNTLERYVLFVNANRYEKNFIRSLEAFCRYKEKCGGSLKLYVLGASGSLQNNIIQIRSINKKVVSDDVNFIGYVSPQELHQYFSGCEFLLYTSKSEGYGLPPLEAMTAGRPTVASSTTSVPEVLGMCAYYVNPYSTTEIAEGIEYMADKKNQEKYTTLFSTYLPIIQQRGEIDMKILVKEILAQ